jgi:hypothetical protein
VPGLKVSKESVAEAGPKLAGVLTGIVFFLVVLVGGGVYRTDCLLNNGQVVTDWGPKGDIPYLWSPGPNCRAHALMRYVLGTVGVMSPAHTFDQTSPELVRQVGRGSVAMAQLVPTFESLKTVGGFSDPNSQQAMLDLFQGQLGKLSASALQTISQENQTAAAHTAPVLRKLNALAASISGSVVDPRSLPGLSADSRTLLDDWNAYLTSTANSLRRVSGALSGMHPFYAEFQQLIEAAYQTAQLHSTAQFDKLRASVIKDMGPRYQRMQAAQQTLTGERSVEQKLVRFVDGSPDSQAIITRVNHGYPSGFLASEFKRS